MFEELNINGGCININIDNKAAIYISGGYAFYSTGTASGDQLTLPSVTVDDPFDDTKSFQLGKPERKTANASRYISTASIDTYTDGPSVTLGPGRWMITGTVNFGSASGSRNMCARFSMGGTAYAEQQRVYAAYGNYATLNVSCDYTNNTGSDVTVTLQGSSSKTISSDNAATWYIVATRLQ